MNKKRIKWWMLLGAPLLFILPITHWGITGKQFRSIITQPQKTGITTLNFFDSARERPVVTEVWYPIDAHIAASPPAGIWIRCDEARDAPLSQAQKKYPLIVMSHGNGCDRYNIAWLAEILTSNGYIVAAMDHYGNTWNNKIPTSFLKLWERPKDISYVIDQIMEHPLFQDKIDEKKIGFAGFSLGGATGMWVAGAQISHIPLNEIEQVCAKEMPEIVSQDVIASVDLSEVQHCYMDKRVSAVLAIAPALGWLFDETSLKMIDIPVYIVAVGKDRIVPIEKNAKVFAKSISNAKLKVVHNEADHYVFLNRPSLLGKRLMAPRFCEDPSTVDRKQVHEMVGKEAVRFFDAQLQ